MEIEPVETLQEEPQFGPGSALGYFLWHDADGFHMRWTTKGKRHMFSGKIVASEEILKFVPVELERSDKAFVGPERKTIRWSTRAKGGIDGFDFRIQGKIITVYLEIDNKKTKTAQIWLGNSKVHPKSNPFKVKR